MSKIRKILHKFTLEITQNPDVNTYIKIVDQTLADLSAELLKEGELMKCFRFTEHIGCGGNKYKRLSRKKTIQAIIAHLQEKLK